MKSRCQHFLDSCYGENNTSTILNNFTQINPTNVDNKEFLSQKIQDMIKIHKSCYQNEKDLLSTITTNTEQFISGNEDISQLGSTPPNAFFSKVLQQLTSQNLLKQQVNKFIQCPTSDNRKEVIHQICNNLDAKNFLNEKGINILVDKVNEELETSKDNPDNYLSDLLMFILLDDNPFSTIMEPGPNQVPTLNINATFTTELYGDYLLQGSLILSLLSTFSTDFLNCDLHSLKVIFNLCKMVNYHEFAILGNLSLLGTLLPSFFKSRLKFETLVYELIQLYPKIDSSSSSSWKVLFKRLGFSYSEYLKFMYKNPVTLVTTLLIVSTVLIIVTYFIINWWFS